MTKTLLWATTRQKCQRPHCYFFLQCIQFLQNACKYMWGMCPHTNVHVPSGANIVCQKMFTSNDVQKGYLTGKHLQSGITWTSNFYKCYFPNEPYIMKMSRIYLKDSNVKSFLKQKDKGIGIRTICHAVESL